MTLEPVVENEPAAIEPRRQHRMIFARKPIPYQRKRRSVAG